MFPDDEITVIETNLLEGNEVNIFNGTAFLYDFKAGDFVYRNGAPILLEGKAALKAWIEKCIRTIKFKAIVHNELEYGLQIEDLIGSVFDVDFVRAEIEREVSEALLRNPYITNIESFNFVVDGSELQADISLNTIYDGDVLEVSL